MSTKQQFFTALDQQLGLKNHSNPQYHSFDLTDFFNKMTAAIKHVNEPDASEDLAYLNALRSSSTLSSEMVTYNFDGGKSAKILLLIDDANEFFASALTKSDEPGAIYSVDYWYDEDGFEAGLVESHEHYYQILEGYLA